MKCPKCYGELEVEQCPLALEPLRIRRTESIHCYCSNCDTEFVSVGKESLRILDEA